MLSQGSSKHYACNEQSSPFSVTNQLHINLSETNSTNLDPDGNIVASISTQSSQSVMMNRIISPLKSNDIISNVKNESRETQDESLKEEDRQENISEPKNCDNLQVNVSHNKVEMIKIKSEEISPELSPKEFKNEKNNQVSLCTKSLNLSEIQLKNVYNEKTLNPLKAEKHRQFVNVPLDDNLHEASVVLGAIRAAGSPTVGVNTQKGNEAQQIVANNNIDYYMQHHQNHIFVFSTQLANKAAESVSSNQHPTIIAYHCMQPTTKSFLDDFFTKNPMKISKFQQQQRLNLTSHMNSLNHNSHGHFWNINNNNNSNCNININVQTKCNTKCPPQQITTSIDSPNLLHQQQNNHEEFLNWGDGPNNESMNVGVIGNPNGLVSSTDTVVGNNDQNGVPSLQGVKVPDENLTPQQRQHREEQLAKLKKMNQFLFPENINEEKIIDIKNNGISESSTVPHVSSSDNSSGINQFHLKKNLKTSSIESSAISTTSNLETVLLGLVDNSKESNNGLTLSSANASINNNISSFHTTESNQITSNTASASNRSSRTLLDSNSKSGQNSSKKISGSSCVVPNESKSSNKNPKQQDEISAENNESGNNRNDCNSSMQEVGINTLITDWKPNAISRCSVQANQPNRTECGVVGNSISNSNNISSNLRNVHGPPPPYHSTQRCTSVPISSSKSPSPCSPTNNPTNSQNNNTNSVLTTLASPRSNVTLNHMNSCSPNIKDSSASYNATTPNTSNQSKSNYNIEDINSNSMNRTIGLSPGSLPPHSEETKSHRFGLSNQTRSKTPSADNSSYGNNSSPGLNVSPQCAKSQSNVDRFAKKGENMPLNPNSSSTRIIQTKSQVTATSFDPITSLAQMSQQLTAPSTLNSSITSNGTTVSNVSAAGGILSAHLNEMNLENLNNHQQNIIDSAGSSMKNLDGCMDTCNMNVTANSSVMNMNNSNMYCQAVGVRGGVGSVIGGNMGIIGQRMIGSKNCSTFSSHSSNNIINTGRDFSNILGTSSPRMFHNRMNFGYNVSPNVQIRASTPNTIQYMPVRAQTNNNNCNLRMNNAPSLEFLQRYASPNNSQIHNSAYLSQMPLELSGENHLHKLNEGTNQGNFNFPICNDMILMGEQEQQNSNQHATTNFSDNNNDLPLNPNMMRGSRQIRSAQSKGQNMSPNILIESSIENMSDSISPLLCNMQNIYQPQQNLYPNSQHQKSNKTSNQPCHTQQPTNFISCNNTVNPISATVNNNSMLPTSEHHQSSLIQSQTLNNADNESTYKFMRSAQSDVKYAQQYHSFQQQLYATSTRGMHNSSNTTANLNVAGSSSSTFFGSK